MLIPGTPYILVFLSSATQRDHRPCCLALNDAHRMDQRLDRENTVNANRREKPLRWALSFGFRDLKLPTTEIVGEGIYELQALLSPYSRYGLLFA